MKTLPLPAFTLLLLALFSISTVQDCRKSDLISAICNKTDQLYDVCVYTLESDPRCNLKVDRKGFSQIAVEAAIRNATDTKAYIPELKNVTKDDITLQFLSTCSEMYERAIYEFQNALEFSDLKDYYEYSTMVHKAGIATFSVETCEYMFQEYNSGKLPLTQRNKYSADLGHVGMQILNINQCGHYEYCSDQ